MLDWLSLSFQFNLEFGDKLSRTSILCIMVISKRYFCLLTCLRAAKNKKSKKNDLDLDPVTLRSKFDL